SSRSFIVISSFQLSRRFRLVVSSVAWSAYPDVCERNQARAAWVHLNTVASAETTVFWVRWRKCGDCRDIHQGCSFASTGDRKFSRQTDKSCSLQPTRAAQTIVFAK